MNKHRKYLAAGVATVALAAGGGTALATGGDEQDTITGHGADSATAAALQITSGGTANSVERDGENGATWEVEVTKPSGDTVDVRLDENYELVVVESDHEPSSDSNDG
ncbi:hypothetical protein BH10ACT11_BH10ACT11_12270 [soil metagenome]